MNMYHLGVDYACTQCKNLRHLVLTVFAPGGARRSVWCLGACTGGWLSGRAWRYLVTNQQPYLVRWAHINLPTPWGTPTRIWTPGPTTRHISLMRTKRTAHVTLQYGQAEWNTRHLVSASEKTSWTLPSYTDTPKRVTIMLSTLT